MFALAVLAGAFIGLGAISATTVTTGVGAAYPFGITKLLGGLVFLPAAKLDWTAGLDRPAAGIQS